jgi:hypothetical protein
LIKAPEADGFEFAVGHGEHLRSTLRELVEYHVLEVAIDPDACVFPRVGRARATELITGNFIGQCGNLSGRTGLARETPDKYDEQTPGDALG